MFTNNLTIDRRDYPLTCTHELFFNANNNDSHVRFAQQRGLSSMSTFERYEQALLRPSFYGNQ